MRSFVVCRMAVLAAALTAGAARTAAADITVITHYTLINGDTLTRASYYTSKRSRVTAPDGKEFMFNRDNDSVTVINHAARIYWTGPRARADSIAQRMIEHNRKQVAENATQDPEAWRAKVAAFNDSIRVNATGKTKMVAGYPCDQFVLNAGHYMTSDRWIARALKVPNYGPEMQKIVMSTIADPLGRVLMRMLIDMRTKNGLVLAGTTTFTTLTQSGSFSFEAVRVLSTPIPKETWDVPPDYTPVELSLGERR